MIPYHVLLDIGSWPLDPGVNTGSVKHEDGEPYGARKVPPSQPKTGKAMSRCTFAPLSAAF